MPGDPGNAEGRAVEKIAIAAWAREHPVGDARVRYRPGAKQAIGALEVNGAGNE